MAVHLHPSKDKRTHASGQAVNMRESERLTKPWQGHFWKVREEDTQID